MRGWPIVKIINSIDYIAISYNFGTKLINTSYNYILQGFAWVIDTALAWSAGPIPLPLSGKHDIDHLLN